MTCRRLRHLAAAVAALLLLLVAAACSSGGNDAGNDDEGSGGSASTAGPAAAERAPEPADGAFDADGAAIAEQAAQAGQGTEASAEPPEAVPGDPRALIKKGNVALRSEDVGTTLFEVRKIVQARDGEIAEENTEADDAGDPERALLVLRVPEDAFEDVMRGLKEIEGARLIDTHENIQDVTTQVIDTDVRVALQRRSIDRISILLDRATSIRDIVSIERELARREADLGSLQKRQAFLADQTSMATISLSLERPREEPKPEPEEKDDEEETGFVAGLEGGWDAFTAVTTGLLTGAGAVLPFALVGVLLGVPAWVLVRRRRPAAPAPATDGQTA